jgi:hypothetical protein
MPILLLPLVLIATVLLIVLCLPFSIVQRYRLGTARRQGRAWMAVVNVFSLAMSTALFLITAAISNAWVPNAFRYTAVGIAAGLALGVLGLRLTCWEPGAQSLYYTPNRWLVLAITVGVALRLCFGFWRAWHAWHASPGEHSWLAESGLAGSMAAGAVVIGYYFAFWLGLSRRIRGHRQRLRFRGSRPVDECAR